MQQTSALTHAGDAHCRSCFVENATWQPLEVRGEFAVGRSASQVHARLGQPHSPLQQAHVTAVRLLSSVDPNTQPMTDTCTLRPCRKGPSTLCPTLYIKVCRLLPCVTGSLPPFVTDCATRPALLRWLANTGGQSRRPARKCCPHACPSFPEYVHCRTAASRRRERGPPLKPPAHAPAPPPGSHAAVRAPPQAARPHSGRRCTRECGERRAAPRRAADRPHAIRRRAPGRDPCCSSRAARPTRARRGGAARARCRVRRRAFCRMPCLF